MHSVFRYLRLVQSVTKRMRTNCLDQRFRRHRRYLTKSAIDTDDACHDHLSRLIRWSCQGSYVLWSAHVGHKEEHGVACDAGGVRHDGRRQADIIAIG